MDEPSPQVEQVSSQELQRMLDNLLQENGREFLGRAFVTSGSVGLPLDFELVMIVREHAGPTRILRAEDADGSVEIRMLKLVEGTGSAVVGICARGAFESKWALAGALLSSRVETTDEQKGRRALAYRNGATRACWAEPGFGGQIEQALADFGFTEFIGDSVDYEHLKGILALDVLESAFAVDDVKSDVPSQWDRWIRNSVERFKPVWPISEEESWHARGVIFNACVDGLALVGSLDDLERLQGMKSELPDPRRTASAALPTISLSRAIDRLRSRLRGK